MDVIAALSGISQAINIAKAVRDAGSAYDKANLKAEMAEVLSKLSDAKLALTEARDEITARDEEIVRLRATFDERTTLKVGPGDYRYRTDPNGDLVGFPMCPRCEANNAKLVQLKQQGAYNRAKCPACLEEFYPVTTYVHRNDGQRGTEPLGTQVSRNMGRAGRRLAGGWEG